MSSAVGGAILVGGAVAAAGTVVAGSEAASATKDAANTAAGVQRDALAQEATLSAPYRALGEAAIPQYESLLGIGPGGASGIKAALEATPGYQFALDQGERGIVNQGSLSGGLSGNTLAALDTFNQGQASTVLGQERAALGSAVGSGQAAAAGQAQATGQTAGNISNIIQQQGQTQAGIDANIAAGLSKIVGSSSDQYLTMKYLQDQGG